MNKMLVKVFDSPQAANAAVGAMLRMHTEGCLTLCATGVITKNARGLVSVRETSRPGMVGTGIGFAVGSLIGLLGGPVGVVAGALTGTLAGAAHDFWVAGIGFDFVEEAARVLQPGKVALIAVVSASDSLMASLMVPQEPKVDRTEVRPRLNSRSHRQHRYAAL